MLVLAAMAQVVGCVFVIDDLPGNFNQARTESGSFPDDLTDLDIEIPAGNVDVQVGPNLGFQADLAWRGDEDESPILEDTTAGVYAWRCRQGANCRVDLIVTVPDVLTTLRLDIDAGDLDVMGTTSDLFIDVDVGAVLLENHTGDVEVDIDAGDIRATDLIADTVMVNLDIGDANLALTERPTAVQLSGDTSELQLEVPAGAYAVTTSVDVGMVDIGAGIIEDANADAQITADVDVGRIEISGS